MTGIEPALSAWEADVLPLNYIRMLVSAGCRADLAPTSYRNQAPGWVLPPIAVWLGRLVRFASRRPRRPTGYCNESKPPLLAVARNEVHVVTG